MFPPHPDFNGDPPSLAQSPLSAEPIQLEQWLLRLPTWKPYPQLTPFRLCQEAGWSAQKLAQEASGSLAATWAAPPPPATRVGHLMSRLPLPFPLHLGFPEAAPFSGLQGVTQVYWFPAAAITKYHQRSGRKQRAHLSTPVLGVGRTEAYLAGFRGDLFPGPFSLQRHLQSCISPALLPSLCLLSDSDLPASFSGPL